MIFLEFSQNFIMDISIFWQDISQKKIWTPCILHNLGQAVISHPYRNCPTSHQHPATPKWLLYLPWSKAWSHEIWKTKKKYLQFLFRMLHLKIPSDLPKKSPSAPIKHLPGLTNPQVVLSGNRPAAGRCARVRGIDAKQAVSSCRKVRTALQGPNFL